VLLLAQKLEMLRIHAAPIEAEVIYLPPVGTIWTGLDRNGSVRFGASNPVGVFWLTASGESDRGVHSPSYYAIANGGGLSLLGRQRRMKESSERAAQVGSLEPCPCGVGGLLVSVPALL
jgi:hypothetical protein